MSRVEAQDETYFVDQVLASGGEVRKVKWSGRNGAPDRLAGWPNGNHAFVELKHPDQSWGVQDHQMREIRKMRSWGIQVWIISGRDEIDAFVKRMSR